MSGALISGAQFQLTYANGGYVDNDNGHLSSKPVTSKPVYGYLMDEDENFIIDEEAAPVVKQIYSL